MDFHERDLGSSGRGEARKTLLDLHTGFLMFKAFMREVRVDGFIPRRRAAPPSPEIFQFTDSSARRMFARSSSSNSCAVRMVTDDKWAGRSAIALVAEASGSARSKFKLSSVAVMTARSMTFCSSRTL